MTTPTKPPEMRTRLTPHTEDLARLVELILEWEVAEQEDPPASEVNLCESGTPNADKRRERESTVGCENEQ